MNAVAILLALGFSTGQISTDPIAVIPSFEIPANVPIQELPVQGDTKDDKSRPKEIEDPKTEDEAEAKDSDAKDESDPAPELARLFPNSRIESFYDRWQTKKEDSRLPFTIGAWHWGHINNGGPNATDYGIPGIQGTYFWYITGDPLIWENPREDGFIKSFGGHFDFRFRENDRFRNFFREGLWFWENYAYFDTKYGKIKGGQIWRRFGKDWDGTFWGNVPYFDGFTLDPDWGFSWENTWEVRDKLKVDTYVQYFIREDGINGSIKGADSESLPGFTERHTGVVRILPTWRFTDNTALAMGVSGMVGQIDSDGRIPGLRDQVNSVWALDATLTHKKWMVFGQFLQSYGVRHPVRFVGEGPSNRISNVWCGVHYTMGPVIFRFSYSAGWDSNPSGIQRLWVPGMTVALTKNVDFHLEYVRWDVRGSRTAFAEFEDGFQLILNWRF